MQKTLMERIDAFNERCGQLGAAGLPLQDLDGGGLHPSADAGFFHRTQRYPDNPAGEGRKLMSPEMLTILMFGTLIALIALGHPLAFTLAGVAVLFGLIDNGFNVPGLFDMFANNSWGLM